ncbi:SIR2 family protein [bacterium]|nr:SIR2 family protein [bacterium]
MSAQSLKNDERLKKIRESLLSVMREQHRWLLLVGTGPSVAMDSKLGMPALADHLLNAIPKNTDGWAPVAERLKKNIDLETALTNTNPSIELRNEIARKTSEFVAKVDAGLRDDILTGKKQWVAEPLLCQLMRGLSPTWPRLPVVTSNYDMLIEYFCSRVNIPYITGYHGGIIKRQDWSKARERLYRFDPVTIGGKRRDTIKSIPRVELMKVHGSINLFHHNLDDSFVENNLWITDYPKNYTPMIAPPGDIKNEELLNFHSCLFNEALRSIDKATAFFVIGYGFRDKHIHQKILDRVRNKECPLVILTLDPSKELESLSVIKNVWVITGIRKTAEDDTDRLGTSFANIDKELCGYFDGVTLWQSDIFAKQILGG